MRIFLPWTVPMLPAAAARLLDQGGADLSRLLVVVRGRNTGRRLLGLLAAEAQRRGVALLPPRIITPGSIDAVLFPQEEGAALAGRLAQRLAWTLAFREAGAAVRDAVWQTPPGSEPRLSAFTLGGTLARTWTELSTSGRDFRGAFEVLAERAPEVAQMEEERWQALAGLLDAYRERLRQWGLKDPGEARFFRKPAAGAVEQPQLALVGVVELAPAMVSLLKRLPGEPWVLIHAPETEAEGFDEWGRLLPGYWQKRPCRFEGEEIHVVTDAGQQAARCAELVEAWRSAGLPPAAVTVAVPEPEALPLLEQELEDRGIPVRSAEGRPASRSPVLQLLSAIARCLEQPPLYTALADLVRHPDLDGELGWLAGWLDGYFTRHLPWRVDLGDGEERMAELRGGLDRLLAIGKRTFARDVTELLLRVYGSRKADRHSSGGRLLIGAVEAVRDALDEIRAIPAAALDDFPPSELLGAVVEAAGEAAIPHAEAPGAVELAGWLEAAADDAPALIVTSVFEGGLPEGTSAEPLLHDSLRGWLGLPCRASRFARDQYTLWAAWVSRRGRGRLALIAPRRNASGNPVRPSRLLTGGHGEADLAVRLLELTSSPSVSTPSVPGGSGLKPPVPDAERMRTLRVFPVTAFRTYLASPRLFYFKTVLGLCCAADEAEELDGAMFGELIHAVLQQFGAAWAGCGESPPSEDAIRRQLEALLTESMECRFGRDVLPPVRGQFWALRERLDLFAAHQAAAFREGWRIACVEGESLETPFPAPGAPEGVRIRGRIDRVDRHPDGRWRVIDYKTSAKAADPLGAHLGADGEWKDLQLPLYVKLLPELSLPGGESVDPERVELVYFNLPATREKAGITAPFPAEQLEPAWQRAGAIIAEVCGGEGCREAGRVSSLEDPVFHALCGLNGLPETEEEEEVPCR